MTLTDAQRPVTVSVVLLGVISSARLAQDQRLHAGVAMNIKICFVTMRDDIW